MVSPSAVSARADCPINVATRAMLYPSARGAGTVNSRRRGTSPWAQRLSCRHNALSSSVGDLERVQVQSTLVLMVQGTYVAMVEGNDHGVEPNGPAPMVDDIGHVLEPMVQGTLVLMVQGS